MSHTLEDKALGTAYRRDKNRAARSDGASLKESLADVGQQGAKQLRKM